MQTASYPPGFLVRAFLLGWTATSFASFTIAQEEKPYKAQLPNARNLIAVQMDKAPGESSAPVLTTVATHPSGKWAATGGDDHRLRIIDLREQDLALTLSGHKDWIQSVAFSPDGKLLVSAGNDRRLLVWQCSDWKLVRTIHAPLSAVHAIAFSKNGKWLAAAGFEKSIYIFDLSNGWLMRQIKIPEKDIRCLLFSNDSKSLFFGGRGGLIGQAGMENFQVSSTVRIRSRRIQGLALTLDQKQVIAVGQHSQVVIWNPENGKVKKKPLPFNAKITSICQIGDRYALGTTDNQIWLFGSNFESPLKQLDGHTGTVAGLTYHPSNPTWFLSCGFDQTLRFWPIQIDFRKASQSSSPGAEDHESIRNNK